MTMGPPSTSTTTTLTMSNSQPYHHREAENGFSFDEMSAVREDFLLVLISTMSGSVIQFKNQKRAMIILEGCGIQPEILDAADPNNATVRDELCKMSGIRGRYPQFFLVQGDKTTFFADFDELDNMNEEGTLLQLVGAEIPPPVSPKKGSPTRYQVSEQDWNDVVATKHELKTATSVTEDNTVATSMIESLQYDLPHEEEEWSTERRSQERILAGGHRNDNEDGDDHRLAPPTPVTYYHPPDDVYCSETEGNIEAPSPISQDDPQGDPQWGDDYFEEIPVELDDMEPHDVSPYSAPQHQQLGRPQFNGSMGSECHEEETYLQPSPPNMKRTSRAATYYEHQHNREVSVVQETASPQRRIPVTEAVAAPVASSLSSLQMKGIVVDSQPLEKTPTRNSPTPNRLFPEPGSWEANFGSPSSMRQGWEADPNRSPDKSTSPNSMFDDIVAEDKLSMTSSSNLREQHEVSALHTLESILSDDEDSVDTTATSSSIVTSTRVTSMDLDLRIQPQKEVHFWLTDETARCTITLSNMSLSYLPLAFKIQASQRGRYMVWPSVGVVRPMSTVSISVFFVEDAKRELLNLFDKLGPAAEFRQQDSLLIEWCGVPSDFCSQLTGDHDADLETLSSYWNTCRQNDGWTSEEAFLRVRVSVDGRDQSSAAQKAMIQSPGISIPTRSDGSDGTPSRQQRLMREGQDGTVAVVDAKQSETEMLLLSEVDNLRRKCEELTAERLIMEKLLEEARERESPARSGAIHKFQLQQTMRCGGCLEVFKSDPSSLRAPILSRSCGHSICRNCCYRTARAKRHSLSSDLLMCVGDIIQVRHEGDDACPICKAANAFGSDRLHVNQSLCLVLKLLDG